jgi:hypothetical protein
MRSVGSIPRSCKSSRKDCGRSANRGSQAEHERLLDSWNNIADGAQVIYDGCMNDFGGVQGTLFQENDWRVMVGADLGCPGS